MSADLEHRLVDIITQNSGITIETASKLLQEDSDLVKRTMQACDKITCIETRVNLQKNDLWVISPKHLLMNQLKKNQMTAPELSKSLGIPKSLVNKTLYENSLFVKTEDTQKWRLSADYVVTGYEVGKLEETKGFTFDEPPNHNIEQMVLDFNLSPSELRKLVKRIMQAKTAETLVIVRKSASELSRFQIFLVSLAEQLEVKVCIV